MDKGVDKGVDKLKVSTARNIIGMDKNIMSTALSTDCPQIVHRQKIDKALNIKVIKN